MLASYPAPGSAAGFAAVAEAFAESIEREGLEAAGERYAWGPGSGLDPAGAKLVRAGFLEHAPHGIAGVLRETVAVLPEPAAQAERLQGLRLPVLVVAGGEDAGSLVACRQLAGALPEARLEVIPGAGHVVNLARPEAFNAALLGFLDALSA